jgi:hypothetical protein
MVQAESATLRIAGFPLDHRPLSARSLDNPYEYPFEVQSLVHLMLALTAFGVTCEMVSCS